MNPILTKIEEIKKAPELFLEKPTLLFLKTFIDGYAMRDCEINGDSCYLFIQEFQTYVEQVYDEELAINWANIINNHCASDKESLEVFFRLMDEYKEKQQEIVL